MILLASLALAAVPVLGWDLEQDDGGFQASGDLQQWRWGTVTAGPGAGYDGRRAWAVGLTGNYLNDATEYLELPTMDLSGVAAPVLIFQQWTSFGDGDAGSVEILEAGGWRRIEPVYGYPEPDGWSGSGGGWEQVSVALPAAVAVQVRFVFAADLTGVGAGWFLDGLSVWDGDVTPPNVVSMALLSDSEAVAAPFPISAVITDDTGVDGVTVKWTTDRGDAGTLALSPDGADSWSGELPGQEPDTRVSYHLTATDGANEVRWPSAGDVSFRVYLAAPLDLTGPSGRVVSSTADLSWTPPESVHPVRGYEVWRSDELVWSGTATEATVPLLGGENLFAVRGLYDAGAGDLSAAWPVTAVGSSLVSLSPAQGWPGETLRLEVTGDHALFVQDEVEVDLGEGIVVGTVEVRDVDRFVMRVALDEAALAGPRDLRVNVLAGELSLEDAFVVQPADTRPRLLAIEPASVEQGDTTTVRVRFGGTMAGTPTVNLGEGIVAEVRAVEGDEVVIDLTVAASAPLGGHLLSLDDGTRIFEGVELEVEDWRPPVVAACATGGGAPRWVALALGLALLRRRRDARR